MSFMYSHITQGYHGVMSVFVVYSKGTQCFSKGNPQVQQCISNTESKMMNLADKQVSKNLSPDSYFRDFCS